MSNIFEEVLKNPQSVEEKLIGANYPYYKNIRTPKELGMSDRGTLKVLGDNINGLRNYVEVLVTGKSRASKTGNPLGNKFFLKTGAKCKNVVNGELVDRYIYVNNVPQGNIPFISDGLGVNFKEFKGLIPGTMSNMNVLNPYNILRAFMAGSTPDCQNITLQTIDVNNNKSNETNFVTLFDIRGMDPCQFQNKKNPLTGARCRETYSNLSNNELDDNENGSVSLPDDVIAQLYFAGLGLLGVYLIYRIMEKSKK
jgi:hypothetical protein